MKVISVIGYSGSGKTHIIEFLIKKLKTELNLEVSVVKNIHEHRIDEEGKDSFKFSEAGAVFSVIKNKFNQNAIYLNKKISLDPLINWLNKSPYKVDLIIVEGFRDVSYPTILCVKELQDIDVQLNKNVKLISGLITLNKHRKEREDQIPIFSIQQNFERFTKIFNIH
ncbi:MAG: molybdopterin-guanine dinucleotide biosynthesis protein B [Candidatus Lokiarchaeota archaeon]|nr:molybdopterin-guanine dinucleotide biosynthesis protein B [Candidatus Lokiarchaeota archaeon]